MTIKKEELPGKDEHGFSTHCFTCSMPIYHFRLAGYGVAQESWDSARRHDAIHGQTHNIVVFEHTVIPKVE